MSERDKSPEPHQACAADFAGPGEATAFDWVLKVPVTRRGWIEAIDARAANVLVAGAEVDGDGNSSPFVASFLPDGKEIFRSALGSAIASSTTPSRSAAVAIKSVRTGSYALISAARLDGPASSLLVALDESGKQTWSSTLDFAAQAAPRLATSELAEVIGVGALGSRDTIGVIKFASNGKPIWSVQFHYQGEVPFVLADGDRTILVGELMGTAQFGAHRVAQVGSVKHRCAEQKSDCTRSARGLVAVELDASGAPTLVRHFGSTASLISVSSAVVSGDGQIAIAGEFMGEPANVGGQPLCETTAGRPVPQPLHFPESSAVGTCECNQLHRNLFALRLNRELQVLWARTLTVGASEPHVATDPHGRTYWSNFVTGTDGHSASKTLIQELGPSGFLGAGWVVDGHASRLTAASDGTIFLGDRRDLKRLANRSR